MEELNDHIDKRINEASQMLPTEKWCYIKRGIAEFSKDFSKQLSSQKEIIISQLSEKVVDMQTSTSGTINIDLLIKTQKDLDDLLEERIHGIMFRTKCNWYEQGEVSSKMFFNMEKRRYNAKTCNRLILDNSEEEISDQKQIIQEQFKFYQKLYEADTSVVFDIKNDTDIKLSEEQREVGEVPFTKEEISVALLHMKSGKTPGEDGLPPSCTRSFMQS